MPSICQRRLFICNKGFENAQTSQNFPVSVFLKRPLYPNFVQCFIFQKVRSSSSLSLITVDFNFSSIYFQILVYRLNQAIQYEKLTKIYSTLSLLQLNLKSSRQMIKKSLYLITGNMKKLEEFKQILGNQFDFQTENVDLPQLQGDPEQIAKQKANIAFKQTQKTVLVEDTSLCFNAYKGLPGPYIKWFLKSVGPEGLAKMVQPFQDKTGYAMCIIAYMSAQLKEPILFVGKTPGSIVQPRGSRDFGWDPVFQPEGYKQTYAQLDKQIKNKISHRFRAIDQMRKYFASQEEAKNSTKKQ